MIKVVLPPYQSPKGDSVYYVVVRLGEGGRREYLYAVTPPLWDHRARLALRFQSAAEADQRTRGIGEWRIIVEVANGKY